MKQLPILIGCAWLLAIPATGQDLQAEYFFDTDPGPGNGIPVAVPTGPSPSASATLDISALGAGVHKWYVRTKQNGVWGFYGANRLFYIWEPPVGGPPMAADIDAAEYFFDADPGPGNGTPLAITPGPAPNISATIDITGLGQGVHLWYVRTRQNGVWGFYGERRLLYIWEPPTGGPPVAADIEAAEYFFDSDPGPGNGIDLPITPGPAPSVSATLDVTGLSEGVHTWYIRTKQNGVWGFYGQNRVFFLWTPDAGTATNIEAAEYFIDTDPGVGNGTPIAINPGPAPFDSLLIDITGLATGMHTWNVRVKQNGVWGLYGEQRTFTVCDPPDPAGITFTPSGSCTNGTFTVDVDLPAGWLGDPYRVFNNVDGQVDTLEAGETATYGPYPTSTELLFTAGSSLDPNACTVQFRALLNCWYEDADSDGFGDPLVSVVAVDQPTGYVADDSDNCPTDPNKIDPGVCGCGVADIATTWYEDADNDGFGDPNVSQPGYTCIQPPGYVEDDSDNCPADPNKIDPGFCGCGVADIPTTWYADLDNDGFGDPNDGQPGFTCFQPPGYVADNSDNCPADPDKIDPGVCGCGTADVPTTWYADTDGDGFGDPTDTQAGFTCIQPPGFVADDSDNCPADPNKIDPGVCGCGTADVPTTWYADADGDGFGDPSDTQAGFTCIQPPGFVADDSDNCPGDPDKSDPGVCGCGTVDVPTTWYADTDGDGFGDPNDTQAGFTCIQPPGYVADNTDNCPGDPDKTDPGVCGCGTADVPTTWYADTDGDGFGDPTDTQAGFTCIQPSGYVADNSDDCPADPGKVNPGICGCGTADVPTTWFADTDGDGFGDPNDAQAGFTCIQPPGYVADNSDDCPALPGLVGDACDDNDIGTINDVITASCLCAGTPVPIALDVRLILEGPYDPVSALMKDSLRSLPDFPLTDPYPGLGYMHTGPGTSGSIPPALLTATGPDAIVDWVLVELRDVNDPTVVVASRSVLLQRDGDLVEPDGSSPLLIDVPSTDYHVAVLHRNHLGCMTAVPLALDPFGAAVDLSDPVLATFGTEARKSLPGAQPLSVLWAGDTFFNGDIKYTGSDNDRDPILQAIGGVVPTNVAAGYLNTDVDLDGRVLYTGAGNDRDPILQNIGGVVPTNTRFEQLP